MDESREAKVAATKARMIELAGKFIDRSRGEVSAMRAAIDQVKAGDVGGLGQIRHFAHKMAGTGATLGFESLSGIASRLERAVESLPEGVVPDAQTQGRLGADLDALGAQLEEDARTRR